MTYDALIIGGGLAGCSAAIQLARRGQRVLLVEKQRYPAHKLCGEFLSTEVMGAFDRLGVLDQVRAAGAHPINRVYLTSADGASFESTLPGTALGLSRFALDHLLFREAQAAGTDARDGTTVQRVEGSLHDGFAVHTSAGTFAARLVLGAYGKRSTLDRKLERPFMEKTTPFVAFKAHYEGAHLPHTIELHAFPGGYCGLSHVEEGRVNACWITHQDALNEAGGRPEAMIQHALAQNHTLGHRFATMQRVSASFLAVSQVTFEIKGTFEDDVCMIGDTAAMIAPLCGDGMAMALHAADLVVPFADDYLRGHLTPEQFREGYTDAWKDTFLTRLRLGRVLHHASIRPLAASLAIRLCQRWPGLGHWLIRKTRG